MNTKDLKSLGGTIVMLGALTSLGVFARSATATQDLGEGRQQPALAESSVLGAVSPQDIPKTVLADDPQVDPENPAEQPNTAVETVTEESAQDIPAPVDTPVPSDTQEPEEERLRAIEFTIQAVQTDDTVAVTAIADELLDGTCSYSFKKGNQTLKYTNDSTGSSCSTRIDANDFDTPGRWSVTHIYTANNRLSEGSSLAALVVTVPEAVLAFTGSSTNIVDDNLALNANLSEQASGTCSFAIESEQTSLLVSSDIVNTSSCSALIPLTQLDGTGEYTVVVTFSSNTDLITTTQQFSI